MAKVFWVFFLKRPSLPVPASVYAGWHNASARRKNVTNSKPWFSLSLGFFLLAIMPAAAQDAGHPAAPPSNPGASHPAAPPAPGPAVSVTQADPLPTPDNGSPNAHGKKHLPVYHLLGFSLRGTKRVDTDALVAALPQHEGDVITNAEIRANAEKIRLALKAAHVHGDMTTAILEREGPGHHIWVLWDVHGEDALSFVPFHGKRHLETQTFSGNVKLSTDALIAATGLHPGDPMPDGRLGDARTGIEQAYDKAMPGAAVQVKGKVKLKKDNSVLIDWQITEPK
jgi:hypothetical protein